MTPVAWLMVAPVLLMLIYALITLFSNHRRHEDLIHEVRDHRATQTHTQEEVYHLMIGRKIWMKSYQRNYLN